MRGFEHAVLSYLFSHHLQKDIKHLITHTNNALHHACEDKEREGETENYTPLVGARPEV